MTHRILIAVCTRRRPNMLARCLDSLIHVEIPDHTDVELLVVENDAEAGMESLVEKISAKTSMAVRHHLETRQGIPFARNAALDEASDNGFDDLVFLDDDEWADPNWLITLYQYAQKKGGQSIIHGHVISEFPPNAPKHLIPLMQRKEKPTGTPLDSCATNNILIPMAPVRELSLRFDERNPFAGGEDVLFTFAAHRNGIEIFECREAVVHEEIPLNRIALSWLARRKYWMGIGQLKRDLQRGEKAALLFPKAVVSLVLRIALVLACALVFNRRQLAKQWLKLCKNAGTIGGLLGRETEAYRTVDGN